MKTTLSLIIALLLTINYSFSQTTGDVLRYSKISTYSGGLGNVLSEDDFFGVGLCNIGDINGDGIEDIAAGIHGNGTYGGIYILFMDTSGNVNHKTKLSQNLNGISMLTSTNYFGNSISCIGDINNDGINDIAVGAVGDNNGGTQNTGAVHIICLDTSGVAIRQTKISKTTGYGSGGLPIIAGTQFGSDITLIGDLNNDGVEDIAVGNGWDTQSGWRQGAVWILFMDTSGNVSSYYKIYRGVTNFNASIANLDYFGTSVECIDDFDNDGINDIAVGAVYDDDVYSTSGSLYIIHLLANGHVKSYSKISNLSFANSNPFPYNCVFGVSIAKVNDIYGDQHDDLVVGAFRYSSDRGAFYVLNFDTNENVTNYKLITYPTINNPYQTRLGRSITRFHDFNQDGYPEIITGAPYENNDRGALYTVTLKSKFKLKTSITYQQCFGDSNGTAKAVAIGANGPFSYQWSNGASTDSIGGLVNGDYWVIATDTLGNTQRRNFSIKSPLKLNNQTSNNSTMCDGNTISIYSITTGGTGNKTYHWNQGLSNASSHSVSPNTTTTYTVYATDANNCSSDTNDIIITVNPLPATSFTGLNVAYCSNANAVNLTGSPSGGTFSGPGISGSVFNPASANTGTNQVVYAYTDANGCVGKDTNTTNVIAAPDVQFSGITSAYCTNDADVTLAGKASPSGGSFWVNSVSSTVFSPSSLGAGTYHIRYAVSNASGCSDEDSITTFVNPSPTASFTGLAASYCENNSSVALNGSPSGGSFSGPGISGTSFYPTNAGLGTKSIKYIYSNMFGCADTAIHTTVVNALTPLSVSTPKNIFCNNDAAVSISVSPSGGTLSGVGVDNSAQTFNPSTSGTGAKTITYTFINPYGCTSVQTHNVTVNAPATLSISGLASSYCSNNTAANITGSPAGDTFFGTGVSGNSFNPVVAGVGSHAVSYRYDNGCVDTLTQNVTVYGLPTVSISGLASSYCESVTSVSLSGTPSGGSFYGDGILGSIFNPEDAGPGSHVIHYISSADSHGCKDTASQSVMVNANPSISFGSMVSNQCIYNSAVGLSASPSGGNFSGSGVSGTNFDPATAGVGTHQVYYSVTDANTCNSIDSFAFVVHPRPSIIFNVGSSCANIPSMALSASPTGGSFSGNYVTGSTFSPLTAGVGSHQVVYAYTDAYSCSNADTQNIVVNALPSVSFSLSNPDFCIDGNSTNLSATPSGGSFSGSGIVGSSFNPATAGVGSHNLVYAVTDANLCSNSDTAVAIVHALPVVSISNYSVTNCTNNQTDTLLGLPSGGSFSGSGMVDSIFNPNTAGVGSHQIVYAYTDGYSCSNSDTVSIAVFAPPTIIISSGLNWSNCKNDSAYALTITPAGGTYSNNFVVNDTFYPNLAPTGYIGYIYTYTDANGCVGAMDDSAWVYDNPVIDAGTDTLLPCGSNGVTIGESPQPNHTYVWSPIAGLNSPFIANPVANPWVDTTIFVVVKTNLSTTCSSKDSVMITLPQPPVVDISGDTVVCFGDSVHLVASGAPNFVWKYGGTTANFDEVLPITQYISVIGTDTNNCSDADSVVVLVNPLPKPNLGPDTTIFMDSIILNPGYFSSYQWNTGDITQTIVVNSNLTPGIYSYSVSVENQFGCSASDTIVISITTDIASHQSDAKILVYPNPSNGLINLEWGTDVQLESFEVFDAYGKLILRGMIEDGIISTNIDLRANAKGTYLIRLQGKGFVKLVKVIID